jgi:hypothetical protein
MKCSICGNEVDPKNSMGRIEMLVKNIGFGFYEHDQHFLPHVSNKGELIFQCPGTPRLAQYISGQPRCEKIPYYAEIETAWRFAYNLNLELCGVKSGSNAARVAYLGMIGINEYDKDQQEVFERWNRFVDEVIHDAKKHIREANTTAQEISFQDIIDPILEMDEASNFIKWISPLTWNNARIGVFGYTQILFDMETGGKRVSEIMKDLKDKAKYDAHEQSYLDELDLRADLWLKRRYEI